MKQNKNWIKWLTTFFGISFYVPLAPGILGILLGGALVTILNYFSFVEKLFFWIFLFLISLKLTDISEKILKRGKDPNVIVLDEINALVFIGLFFDVFRNIYLFGYSFPLIFLIIFIFTLFDALKIFPANISERLKGGRGIVIDDLISALYTILLIKIFLRI
ncbi:MAG: phosphatidylglycerophosphatase A [Candidatus Paceibacterota bacterium]